MANIAQKNDYFKQPFSFRNDDQAFNNWFSQLSNRLTEAGRLASVPSIQKNEVRRYYDQQLTPVQAYNLLMGLDF